MFAMAILSDLRSKIILNFALKAGSSKHGNALRASVGANNVVDKYLKSEKTNRECYNLHILGRLYRHVGYCDFG